MVGYHSRQNNANQIKVTELVPQTDKSGTYAAFCTLEWNSDAQLLLFLVVAVHPVPWTPLARDAVRRWRLFQLFLEQVVKPLAALELGECVAFGSAHLFLRRCF